MRVPTIHVTWVEFNALVQSSGENNAVGRKKSRVALVEFARRVLRPEDFAQVEVAPTIQLQPQRDIPELRLSWAEYADGFLGETGETR